MEGISIENVPRIVINPINHQLDTNLELMLLFSRAELQLLLEKQLELTADSRS